MTALLSAELLSGFLATVSLVLASNGYFSTGSAFIIGAVGFGATAEFVVRGVLFATICCGCCERADGGDTTFTGGMNKGWVLAHVGA